MSSRTSNVTAAFIDLATFELLESSLYGGSDAITYFVREVQKCTWFSQIPVKLTSTGQANFGTETSWTVSRSADYLLGTWLRVQLPPIAANAADIQRLAYTDNLGHALIDKAELLFNDLEVQSFNSYDLDWYAALMVPGGKQAGHYNMIGQRAGTFQRDPNPAVAGPTTLSAGVINVPLPFFYTRDSGVALPTAALPYNDIKIRITFKKIQDVVVSFDADGNIQNNAVAAGTFTRPKFDSAELWCNYAVVSNDERSKMGAGPRDIAIEQFQKSEHNVEQPAVNAAFPDTTQQFSFNHSVKMIVFSVKNTTVPGFHSNYNAERANGADQQEFLETATLKYDNTERFQMDPSFFQEVQPYYHAASCPHGSSAIRNRLGYNMYSFALNPMSQDPNGSTNFGKLTNVSLKLAFNSDAVRVDAHTRTARLLIHALSMNIVRVSGGALGFPVL